MVKASGQIEKELGLLQRRTEDMAEALDPLYNGYLKALGEASKQQLMSAVYHLCTQAYPDKFLALSWKQRNQLQASLQTLAAQISVQLFEQRSQVKKNSRKPSRNNGLAFLQRLLEARASGAVIHTQEGSSDDLLDKLSEIARFESTSGRTEENRSEASRSKPLASPPDDEDPSLWGEDVPSAEERVNEEDRTTSEQNVNEPNLNEPNLNEPSAESPAAPQTPTQDATDNQDAETNYDATDPTDIKDLEVDDFDFEPIDEPIDLDSTSISSSLSSKAREDFDQDGLEFEMDVPAAEQRLTISDEEDLLGALEALARRSAEDEEEENSEDKPLAPTHLMKQKMLMDQAIQNVFKTVSEAANELLQEADVMPKFPKALMAAATDSRGLGEPVNAVPNVVKVSVRVMHGEANFDMLEEDERGRDRGERPSRRNSDRRRLRKPSSRSNSRREGRAENQRPEGRRADHRRDRSSDPRERLIPHEAIEIEAFPEFAVINLQLSEVEFADPRVSVWRSRLRKELSHLKQLGARYKKTQRSLETAQAEDAWRSSWTSPEES